MSDATRDTDVLKPLSSLAHLKWLHVLLQSAEAAAAAAAAKPVQLNWYLATLLYVIASSSPISSQHNTYCTYLPRNSNKPLC